MEKNEKLDPWESYIERDVYIDPWESAYQANKQHYTREEIDEMMLCELMELANQTDE